MKFEQEIFELISHTGEARNNIFNALNEMMENNKEKSDEFLKLANQQMIEAHNMQTKLIQKDIEEDGINVSLLMVHAQDQFMTAMSEEFLVKKMIEMYGTIHALEAKVNV
ncbi:PTS lactose/cellobiose transporter subunit IIA [Clostridium uliginosum]|uniref:PTS system, cellobiose-specific IIA component n=1 Tax=Clostridium uliginosum TaxID=119641 RepID=A0A1I1N734_9CLOT|nr:PTS lactose/cellobiose transporter subunit IIA [Clostridium uliginosum]SFC90613.1 PTS system, cellobiose-specific IIA component [Clostridium uliginosum]